MSDADKIDALTDLLGEVMHTLEMKMYDIENPEKSHQCEIEADKFHQKMLNILHHNV